MKEMQSSGRPAPKVGAKAFQQPIDDPSNHDDVKEILLVAAKGHQNAMIKAKIQEGSFNWLESKIRRKFKIPQNEKFSLKYSVDIQGKPFNVKIQDDEDMEILNSYNEKGKILCNLVNVTAMQMSGAIGTQSG